MYFGVYYIIFTRNRSLVRISYMWLCIMQLDIYILSKITVNTRLHITHNISTIKISSINIIYLHMCISLEDQITRRHDVYTEQMKLVLTTPILVTKKNKSIGMENPDII